MRRESKFSMMGWFVAIGLLGVMVGSGFQTPNLKLGVVDITKIISDSEYGKESQRILTEMKKSRMALFSFIDDYRVLTLEQSNRLRELMLKPTRTKEEDAEMERIKAEVIVTSKKSQEISTKANLNAEDRAVLEEYARRSQAMNQTLQRWYKEAENEISEFYDARKVEGFKRARAAVTEVAGKESYTLIFETSVVPFGTNDLTDPSLVAMNAKGTQ